MDVDGTNNTSSNDDLFFEKITYDGLNISEILIGSDCTAGFMRNKYTYDGNHRLTDQFNIFYTPDPETDRYSTHYEYDLAGNLEVLQRNGLITDGANPTYGPIDDLVYSYQDEHLHMVEDLLANTDPVAQVKGFKHSDLTYGYDGMGNIVNGEKNGATVLTATYNPLNLPRVLTGEEGTALIDYTLSGQKIRKESTSANETRHYFAGFEFKDGIAETYYHGAGRVNLSGENPLYEYTLKDHLGNTVVMFADKNADGLLSSELAGGDPSTWEVLKRDFYYPFGMAMEGQWSDLVPDPSMDYLYNGKEKDDESGWYFYGFRMYDPAIARFTGVDPIADQFAYLSVYNYASNDPVVNIDLHGLQGTPFYSLSGSAWLTERQNPKKAEGLYQIARGYEIYTGAGSLAGGLVWAGASFFPELAGSVYTNPAAVEFGAGAIWGLGTDQDMPGLGADDLGRASRQLLTQFGDEAAEGVAKIAKGGFKVEGQLTEIFGNKKLFSNWLKGNQSLSRVGNPLNATEAQQIINNAKSLGLPIESNLKGLQGLEITGQWGGVPHFKVGNVHIPIEKELDGVLKF